MAVHHRIVDMTQPDSPRPASSDDSCPSPPRRRPARGAGSTSAVLLLLACGLAFVYSMFAGMATDVCSGTARCSDGLIGAAYAVAWGGIAAAALVTLVGMGRGAPTGPDLSSWPRLGWVIFLVTYVAGGLLLHAGVGG